MKKAIVKQSWLSLPSLQDTTELEANLLEGLVSSPADLPTSASRLSPIEQTFVLAKSAQICGQPAKILSLLKPEPGNDTPEWLQDEQTFLRGFALSRMGRSTEADAAFRYLPAKFQPRVAIERALTKVNQGDFIGAESLFTEQLEKYRETFDPYTLSTLLGGLSLALINQGHFQKAEKCLRERRQLLKVYPSTVLSFGLRLYEILLELEKNDFENATQLLSRSLSEQNTESVNGFFLSHLKLRLHLAKNQLDEAGESLSNLKDLTKKLNLPEGVLDFRLEEIEWKIRSRRSDDAHDAIEELLQKAIKNRDEYLHFRLSLLKGQSLALRGQTVEALTEITSALEKGEDRSYRPGLSWAFFHAAGISLAAGQAVQAKLFLNRGRRLAAELGLRARQACFSYMSEVLENRYASASALISLAKYQEIGPELEYFLDSYELLGGITLGVHNGQKQEVIAEPQLRRMLFRNPGIFWFQKEAVLLSNQGRVGQVRSLEFAKESPLLACFRLLWSGLQQNGPGLNLRDIHKTRSPHSFQEELHASAAKMLVSRLRSCLKGSELSLIFDRQVGRYSLVPGLPFFTILSTPKMESENAAPRKDRETEILERIAMEPFVSTKKLCEEFGVSRQALHPVLNGLTKAGRVRMVRRGPISGYIYKG